MYFVNKSNISIFLFQLGLLLRFYFITLDKTSLVVDLFFYILFLSALVIQWKFSLKNLCLISFLFCWSLIFSSSDKRTLFFLFVMCYFFIENANLKDFYKITIFLFFVLCLIICCGIFLGINQDIYFVDYDGTKSLNLGFKNPNTAAMYFYGFSICLVFLIKKSFKSVKNIFLILLIISINLLISFITNSRGAMVCSIFICLCYFLIKKLIKSKVITFFMLFAPTIILIIQIVFCLSLKKYAIIDIFLTGRLSLYNQLITNSSIVDYIFGNANIITKNELVIDNAYFRLLYAGGIPCFVLFQILYFRAIKVYLAKNKNLELCVILSFIVYGIIESIFTNITVFTVLVFWTLIFDPQISYKKSYKIQNFLKIKYFFYTKESNLCQKF